MMAQRLTGRPSCAARGVRPTPRVVRAQALFGWGSKDKGVDEDKDEAYRLQQEALDRRRSGASLREASERRRKVAETMAERKAVRREEKEALGRGEMPDTLKKWKPYTSKLDEKADSGIVVPLLPFGLRKYDEGERFDLRSPYAEEGWVDPNETNAWESVKNIGVKLLNFGRANKTIEERSKGRIIWATQWDKEQAAKKQPGGGNGKAT